MKTYRVFFYCPHTSQCETVRVDANNQRAACQRARRKVNKLAARRYKHVSTALAIDVIYRKGWPKEQTSTYND